MEEGKDPLVIKRNKEPIDLEGLWSPSPGFLVGGGPSLQDFDINRLRERGIVSLGINQCAAMAPVKAWVFSDAHWKFHHALFLDPAIMSFVPTYKATRWAHAKTELGFQKIEMRIKECPNTLTYDRQTCFVPETFFTTPYAHWGPSKDQPKDRPFPNENEKWSGFLCTMMIGLRILYYLGCRRIYLLGIDFQGKDGKCYGFPEEKLDKGRWERRYGKEERMLDSLNQEMENRGIEMFNCNPNSRCSLYSHVPFDLAIKDCKGSIPDEPLDTFGWYDKKENESQCQKNPELVPRHYERFCGK